MRFFFTRNNQCTGTISDKLRDGKKAGVEFPRSCSVSYLSLLQSFVRMIFECYTRHFAYIILVGVLLSLAECHLQSSHVGQDTTEQLLLACSE